MGARDLGGGGSCRHESCGPACEQGEGTSVDVSKGLTAAAAGAMAAGVVLATIGAALTDRFRTGAVVYWPAFAAWAAVGVVLAVATAYVAVRQREGDLDTTLRWTRWMIPAQVVYITGMATVSGGLLGVGGTLLALLALFAFLLERPWQVHGFVVLTLLSLVLMGALSHTWVPNCDPPRRDRLVHGPGDGVPQCDRGSADPRPGAPGRAGAGRSRGAGGRPVGQARPDRPGASRRRRAPPDG